MVPNQLSHQQHLGILDSSSVCYKHELLFNIKSQK